MGKAFRTLILAMAATLAVASCSENEPEDITRTTEDSKVYLKIGSVTTSELTKAAIEGTSFPTAEAASIGLFLGEVSNKEYSKLAGSDTWTDPQIELPFEGTTLYGYYPYSSEVTSLSSIPVSSSIDGDDWMWTTPVEDVSASKPDVSLSMNHALALVEVTFNITGYDASEKITDITLTGKSFSADGTLDATTGVITSGTACATGNEFSKTVSLSQADSKIVAKCLLVPTRSGTDAEERQDFKVSITIGDKNNGGKTLSATLSGDKGVVVKGGTKSTVSLNVKGTTMEVAEVGISGWNTGVATATVGGYTVTLNAGDVPASITSNTDITTDDESIESASRTAIISYDKSVLADGKYRVDATCDKTGACTITPNIAAGTITVSKVTDNITITLSKNVNWYDVTLTTEGNGTAYIDIPGVTFVRCTPGSSVTLTATPGPAEEFIGWQDAEGNSLSKDNPLTYTPTADIALKAVFTTHILSGVFTVGTDGSGNARKARFSGGNLWYDGSNFNFEDRQYESSPSSDGSRDNGHISHFMWCSTATGAISQTYTDDGVTTFFAASSFTVYGNSGWYTPGHSEVQSLLYGRNASTVFGVANARWFKGRINTSGTAYVNGLFLIPDVFAWPKSVTAAPGTSINDREASYTAASFSLAEFKTLEQAGIVFLPAAGNRDGSSGSTSVSNVNAEGFYWVSGHQDGMGDNYAEEIHFTSSKFYPGYSDTPLAERYMAQSVRLLIDVTE